MNTLGLLRAVCRDLSSFMEKHGYAGQPATGRFVKVGPTLDKRITLTICRWSNGSGYHIDHYCEFRLHAIQALHNRYLDYRSDKTKRLAPTISVYFLNLVPRDFDWKQVTVSLESDIPSVSHGITQICGGYSFPFLDRFETADEVVAGFRRDRHSWAEQDPILRYELQLLHYVLQNNREEFEYWHREATEFCGNRKDGRAIGLIDLGTRLKADYFP